MVVMVPQCVLQDTLAYMLTAVSSIRQVTAVLDPRTIWLSSLRPLVVSYGDEAAALFAVGSRLVRRFEVSGDVGLGDAAVVRSLAELASDMCMSVTTLGLLHRLAIHLDPAALGGPPFHRAFECRILVRDSEQSLSSDEKALSTAAAACWTDTTASTRTGLSGVEKQRRRRGSPRRNHQAVSEACAEKASTTWASALPSTLDNQGPHPRTAGERVTSTCTNNVTWMNSLSSSMSRPVCLQHSTATHHIVDATLHLHNLRVLEAGTAGHESVSEQCA